MYVDKQIYEDPWYWDGHETDSPGFGQWGHFSTISAILKETLNFTTLLDVGCGCGYFVATDPNFYGIDFSSFATSHPAPEARGRTLLCSADKIRFLNNTFDCLFSCSTLEHIPLSILDKVLSEFTRVSKKWLLLNIGTTDLHPEVEEVEFEGGEIPASLNQATQFQVSRGHWLLKSRQWWIRKLATYATHRWDKVAEVLDKTSKIVPPTDQAWVINDPGLFILEKEIRG